MAFTHKRLDLTFELGQGGKFGEEGSSKIKITGLRVSLVIEAAGDFAIGNLQLAVWGLTLDHMNELSTIGRYPLGYTENWVTIEAGDSDGVAVTYRGNIMEAWADFNAMPDVVFHIMGSSDMLLAMKPVAPVSFKGGAQVADVFKAIGEGAGYTLINHGVSTQISDPALKGTTREQLQSLADASHVQFDIDPTANTLTIWPRGGPRDDSTPQLISVSSTPRMVGYPAYTRTGLILTTEFNPNIRYNNYVQVESDVKPACGKWYVAKVSHYLDSETPNGQWFTRLDCTSVQISIPATNSP